MTERKDFSADLEVKDQRKHRNQKPPEKKAKEEKFNTVLEMAGYMYNNRTPEQIKKVEDDLKEFRKQWVGRKYKCLDTGEEFTIPSTVRQRDFFSFGNCFVDVGRLNAYARYGGNIKEITKEKEND